MRRWLLGVALAAFVPAAAYAQTDADLLKADKDTHNIFYGGGYSQNRYSPLDKINTKNVGDLTPLFAVQLSNDKAHEEQPILWQGVFYLSDHNATMAVDAKTGQVLWKNVLDYPADLAKEVCCGQISRGVAVYDGKVFRASLDDNLYAYDAKTGKELWKQNVFDYKQGYAMTGAPLIAEGVLMTGIAGAEYGARDFIDGWDPATGKRLWRTYIPACAPDKGGDTWGSGDGCKRGGGSTWITGSYDPETHMVYWGTGNPGSWFVADRPGDNLYTSSVIAFSPKDGQIKWHYQFSPHDGMDFDGVNEMVLTTLKVDGKDTKVILHADRNSFFYVIDRTTGKLIQAYPFAKQNWAEKIDLQTGRPVLTQDAKDYYDNGKPVALWPYFYGGKNWSPMSFDQQTGLVYINALNYGFKAAQKKQEYHAGEFYFGADFLGPVDPPDATGGFLKAIEPMTGKVVWQQPSFIPRYAGILTTGGGIVVTGKLTGEVEAFDAANGKELWHFQAGSGVEGQPITYEVDGHQYIAITSGNGGVLTSVVNDPRLANIPRAGTLWVFGLHSEQMQAMQDGGTNEAAPAGKKKM
jgi:alcohol dehydrogenase (cytochrome c)